MNSSLCSHLGKFAACQYKMASVEVMCTGMRVAVAFLLSEILTLLEKGEEKDLFA
jgi:hypothetical protein